MTSLDPNSAEPGRPRRARWMLSRPAKAGLILILVLATAALTWGGVRLAQNWLDRTQTIHFFVTRDGPDRQFAEKLAQVMAGAHEFIRIAVTPSDDPLGAFSRREADLVVARSDAKLPGWSRAVAKLEKEIVLLAARKGANLTTPAQLKAFSFIFPAPSLADQALLRDILSAYEIGKDARQVVVQSNLDGLVGAVRTGSDKAIFAVAPLSRLVQGHLLGGLPQRLPIALLDWPDSKALAQKLRGVSDETIDVGLFSVSPLLPADDLDTLSLTDLLLARDRLPEATVADIARAIFESKSDLAIEGAFATAIEPPDTDKDAAILAHPGAVQYVNDDEKSFLDRYGDWIYLATPIASVIGSLCLYVYTRLSRVKPLAAGELAEEVLAVAARARGAESAEELDIADERLDEILHETLRDLQAKRLTPEGLDVFRLAYEQTREWIKGRRRLLAAREKPAA